eukprot:GSMAST32.ASY1.ANO1.2834.1 assembled CDS
MSLPSEISDDHISSLKTLVKHLSESPTIVHHKKLEFFKEYLQGINATLPAPVAEEPSSDESLDDGCVTPDERPFPKIPTFGGDSDNWEAAAQFKQDALAAISQKDYVKAVECYSKALDSQASVLTLAKRAGVLLQCSPPRPNAAISDTTAALKQNPDSAKSKKIRGKAYRMLGKWVDAATDLRDAQRVDYDPETAVLLKEVESHAKKIQDRKQKLRRLLKEKELQRNGNDVKLKLHRNRVCRQWEAVCRQWDRVCVCFNYES